MNNPLAGNPQPNSTARIFAKLATKPFGTRLFGTLVALKAPFFLTSQPQLLELRPGFAKVRLRKWWLQQNHIKTIHVMSALNAAEFAMGCVAEATVPDTHRWLPRGMTTDYARKTVGGLTVTARLDVPDFSVITKETGGQRVPVELTFVDDSGQEPMTATIDIWISAKR